MQTDLSPEQKHIVLNKLYGEARALALGHGDYHAHVSVEIIDTDPAPMPGPYVQVVITYSVLLTELHLDTA